MRTAKIILLIISIFISWNCHQIAHTSKTAIPSNDKEDVKTGLDVLLEKHLDVLYGKNIALVTNHSGIDKNGKSNITHLIANDSIKLVKIGSPEHGFTGDIPAGENVDDKTNYQDLPQIISLYGTIKKPTREMLSNIDIIIYDIQDVGARFYTYISTLGLIMEAAGEAYIPIIILDRPNPLGNKLDGPVLNTEFKSFIGMYPIPIEYGMTVGELAQMIIGEKMIEHLPELTVFQMENYSRKLYYDETNLKWTKPSPNIPDLETALIYPGLCLLEATNVSEGRGTYSPFKQIGAPWIVSDSLINLLIDQNLSGVGFSPIQFIPKSIPTMSKYPKYENQICDGVAIHITNRDAFKSILTGVSVLWAINILYPESLSIKEDSMGRLWGSGNLYKQLKNGKTPIEIVNSFQAELNNFKDVRNKYLIYP